MIPTREQENTIEQISLRHHGERLLVRRPCSLTGVITVTLPSLKAIHVNQEGLQIRETLDTSYLHTVGQMDASA